MLMTPEELEGIQPAEVPPAVAENTHSRRDLFRRAIGRNGAHGYVESPQDEATCQVNALEETEHVIDELVRPYVQANALYPEDPMVGEAMLRLSETTPPRQEKFSRRHALRLAGKTALVAAWVIGGTVAAERVDRFVGDKIWPSTKPLMHEIPPLPGLTVEQLRHGTFICGGFNTKNATKIANALQGSLGSNGRLFGVEYDNKGIQLDELVDAMEAQIKQNNLQEISFYGHSMGGDVALLATVELLKRNPKLAIRNIMLDCSPLGFETVRAKNKGMGAFFANLKVRGGPEVRMAIELWNSPNRQTFLSPARPVLNTRAILARMMVIKDEKFNSYAVSNSLAADQISVIEAVDTLGAFDYIARTTEQQFIPPVVTLFRPLDGTQDAMVDVDASEETLRSVGAETRTQVSTVLLDGNDIHHADPVASQEKYNAALLAMIESQAESSRMRKEARLELVRGEQAVASRLLGAQQNGMHPN